MTAIDPLLREIPEWIETERLQLRAPESGDGAALNESIRASQTHLSAWMPWAQTVPTVEESEVNVRRAKARFILRQELRYHLWLQPEGRFVGCVGMHNPDWRIPALEIGYWIDVRYEGQGLIAEAIEALVEMALRDMGVRRLAIRCDAHNLRSQAVPLRLGFELEATLRNDDVAIDGSGLRDTFVFVRLQ
ncbi:N-acetyltransferase [bacterium]|nr:MAG: N-acetyltransferase [bacterium]